MIVVKAFKDLEDSEHLYEAGDVYPREGISPSPERIMFLLVNGFIDGKYEFKVLEETEDEDFEFEVLEEEEETEEDYTELTVKEIKEKLDELGVEYESGLKKAELIEVLEGVD